MNNHQIRALTAGLVAGLVLTALFLLVKRTPLVVTGYCFSLLGIVEFFGTLLYVAGSSKNSVLTNAAFPLAVEGYGVVTIFFSVLMAAVDLLQIWTMPVGWFIFVQIVFAAFLIWRLLAMRSGQEEIERVERNVEAATISWRSLRADAEAIRLRANGASLKDIAGVCDAFRYADPVETPALAAIDGNISENLIRLGQLVDADDAEKIANLCVTLQRQIKERNIRLKMLK